MRATAVVIDPELEAWVWSEFPHVCNVLGWSLTPGELRTTLEQANYVICGHAKPHHPKEALDQILRLSQKRHSSALFLQLAQTVSFEKCKDPSFLKLKATLRSWFKAPVNVLGCGG